MPKLVLITATKLRISSVDPSVIGESVTFHYVNLIPTEWKLCLIRIWLGIFQTGELL
jgi:hypothetical protein